MIHKENLKIIKQYLRKRVKLLLGKLICYFLFYIKIFDYLIHGDQLKIIKKMLKVMLVFEYINGKRQSVTCKIKQYFRYISY